MSQEFPSTKPEKKERVEDNDRKFITEPIDDAFLSDHAAITYNMVSDWIQIGEDEEAKLVCKTFINEDGREEAWFITKVTVDGHRVAEKQLITKSEYRKHLAFSMKHDEKRRSEFKVVQNGTTFSLKYDAFADGRPSKIEVNAASKEERALFNPDEFPFEVTEVTADKKQWGYRAAAS